MSNLSGSRQAARCDNGARVFAVAHLTVRTTESRPVDEGRLDSWKEIAAHLRRDVRTVQRWEKREGLPVHRHQHHSLGSVYAYRHELDAWREGREPLANGRGPSDAPAAHRLSPWAVYGGLLVLASAGLVASRALPLRERRAPVVVGSAQVTRGSQIGAPALAVDDARLYFTQKEQERLTVTVVPTAGGEPETVPIDLPSPAVADVSPDGTELLVLDASVQVLVDDVLYAFPLYRVSVSGGPPRRVGEVMAGGASWLPDGRTILYSVGRELRLVDRDEGAPRTLVRPSGVPACALASPDGRVVRYSVVAPDDGTWSLWEIGADGEGLRPVLPGWRHGQDSVCGSWSSRGGYFFLSSAGGTAGLWFLGRTGGTGDEAQPVRLTTIPMPTGGSRVSRDGRRFFFLAGLASGRLVFWDQGSGQFATHPARIPGAMVDYSPEGTWLVYVTFLSNRLWRARADGTERRPLTPPDLEVAMPRWSPDGTRLVFQARSPGHAWRIYAIPSTGGEPVPLADGDGEETDPTWSPDGHALAFAHATGEPPEGRRSLRVLDVATGRASELPGSEGTCSPRWSPDGRHLAALTPDYRRLLVLDLGTGEWSERATGDLGFPTWSRDGSFLYCQTRDDVILRVPLAGGPPETVVSRASLPHCTFVSAWFGLDPAGRLLLMREEGGADVFAYDLAYR
jgi:dipeptidyl aminopeptidase/acylaminoacyl peptidase